ncbi:tetratricopeptide repeat protein, partial [Dokdonella sp.]|uniref:tetratricopeptide repeat protein n=1 Tax=Dokdonella sp. TaxID=2291710 RepID=UPI003C4AFE8C
ISAGLYDAAEATSRSLLSLSPDRPGARGRLAVALLLEGDAAGALVEARQLDDFRKPLAESMAYHALGRKAESDAALAELTVLQPDERPTYDIASVHAFRGEADQAFLWLELAAEESGGNLPTVMLDPLFENLHEDPRWLQFLRSVGKAPEDLAKIRFHVPMSQASTDNHQSAPAALTPTSPQ